jgi:hypothetical protein
MCQILTQGTIFNGTSNNYKCTCDNSKTWSTVLSKCVLIECETGWKRYGNKCYKAFSTNTGITWTEAKSNCANQNYTLASVFNKAIFDFYNGTLNNYKCTCALK